VNLISKSRDGSGQQKEKALKERAQGVPRHWQIMVRVRYEHEIAEVLRVPEEPHVVGGEELEEGGHSRVRRNYPLDLKISYLQQTNLLPHCSLLAWRTIYPNSRSGTPSLLMERLGP
jgi:hypothetical protein